MEETVRRSHTFVVVLPELLASVLAYRAVSAPVSEHGVERSHHTSHTLQNLCSTRVLVDEAAHLVDTIVDYDVETLLDRVVLGDLLLAD